MKNHPTKISIKSPLPRRSQWLASFMGLMSRVSRFMAGWCSSWWRQTIK